MFLLRDPFIVSLLSLTIAGLVILLQPTRRPYWWLFILTIVFFAFPRAGFTLEKNLLPLPIPHILTAILGVEWFLRRHHSEVGPPFFKKLVIVFALTAFFSACYGLCMGGRPLMVFLDLCFYFFSLTIFFFCIDTFRERRQFNVFIGLILSISMLVSVYGLLQVFWGTDILIPNITHNTGGGDYSKAYLQGNDINYMRVLSSYGDPNVLSSQLLLFIGIAFSIMIGHGIRLRYRLFCVLVVVCNIVCLVLTGSRAAMICLPLVIIILLCLKSRWVRFTVLFLIPMGMILMHEHLFAFLNSPMLMIINDERLSYPQKLVELLLTSPFGSGLGNNIYLGTPDGDSSLIFKNASNVFDSWNSFWMNLVARMGIQGFLCFVFLLGTLWHYIWRQSRHIHHPLVQASLLGGLAGMSVQMLIWLVNNTYMLPGGGLNFWFMMGMMVVGCHAYTHAPEPMMVPCQPMWTQKRVVPTT